MTKQMTPSPLMINPKINRHCCLAPSREPQRGSICVTVCPQDACAFRKRTSSLAIAKFEQTVLRRAVCCQLSCWRWCLDTAFHLAHHTGGQVWHIFKKIHRTDKLCTSCCLYRCIPFSFVFLFHSFMSGAFMSQYCPIRSHTKP